MAEDSGNNKPGERENKWKEFSDKLEEKVKTHKEKEEQQSAESDEQKKQKAEEYEGIEFPSRKNLEDQLTAMEIQLDEYKNKYLRAHAEMKNLQQRTEREISNVRKYGMEKLVIDLLPTVDSLNRAIEMINKMGDQPHMQSVHEGLQLTSDLLEKTLRKHGVEEINPTIGDEFNPALHEAMSVQENPDAKSNTILQVLQKGYQLNGRVLRAAMVIVVK